MTQLDSSLAVLAQPANLEAAINLLRRKQPPKVPLDLRMETYELAGQYPHCQSHGVSHHIDALLQTQSKDLQSCGASVNI